MTSINQLVPSCDPVLVQRTKDETAELLDMSRQGLVESDRFDTLLSEVFGSLIGISLMKVDVLYRQIYYVDIYHPLLTKSVLKSIKQSVLVPLNQGSVGFAARIGGLSLSDSLSDPRGTVAIEDLLQGNVSIMMVGVGRQPVPEENACATAEIPDLKHAESVVDQNSSDLLDEPKARWSFSYADRSWHDNLQIGREQCAGVAFCFFPVAEIFGNFRSTSLPGVSKTAGDRTISVGEADSDRFAGYQLFTDVCRNYEHALLGEAYRFQAKFVTKKMDEALREKENRTLDVLASLESADNPTGGLLALRCDKRDVRICVPKLESSLSHVVSHHPSIQAVLREIPMPSPPNKDDPLLQLLTSAALPLEFGHGNGDERPLVKLILHALSSELDETLLPNFDRNRLPVLSNFFRNVQQKYFEIFERVLTSEDATDQEESEKRFGKAKVALDAYEGVARIIAGIVCSGLNVTLSSPFFKALRADEHVLVGILVRLLDLPFQLNIKDEKSAEHNRVELLRELKDIDESTEELRKNLIGVSIYYWAAHHIEPMSRDAPVSSLIGEIGKDLSSRINAVWNEGSHSVRRLLRMLCLKSMLEQDPIYLAYSLGKKDHKSYQYVIPLTHSLESDCALTFHFHRGDIRTRASLKYCFLKLDRAGKEEVANSVWRVEPEYRIAALCLNKENLEKWVRGSILSWTSEELDSDEIVKALTNYLNARKVDLRTMADTNNRNYFKDWKVNFYTIDGRWTKLGSELVRRMKDYEDRLQQKEEAVRSRYAKGAAHGFKNALLLPPLFLERNRALSALNASGAGASVEDILQVLASVENNTNVASLLLQQLQLQAQLFFWVMAPDRFVQEKDDNRQETRWPELPAGSIATFAALLGMAIVFNTTPTPAFDGRITDPNNLRVLGKLAASRAVKLLSWRNEIEILDRDIQHLLSGVAQTIPDFSISASFVPNLRRTLGLKGVDRGVLEGILVELAQNAVRAALSCPLNVQSYVTLDVSTAERCTIITLRNLAPRQQAERLWEVAERTKSEEYSASGGIRGLSQVRALQTELGLNMPFNLQWPQRPDSAIEEEVEIAWSLHLGE